MPQILPESSHRSVCDSLLPSRRSYSFGDDDDDDGDALSIFAFEHVTPDLLDDQDYQGDPLLVSF